MSSTFRIRVLVPRQIRIRPEFPLDREAFYSWIWETMSPQGLIGVHEGTLLSERAAELGMETESWTIDSGEAPRERDWISGQEQAEAELYFHSVEGATEARESLTQIPGLSVGIVEEQKPQDWDADWKASFQGARVKPFWTVIPPWVRESEKAGAKPLSGEGGGEVILRVNPGAGFGTGTHETTQLCLEALGAFALKAGAKNDSFGESLLGKRVLDFGSGSGILAIGAALLGARVDAVEIDALAVDNAIENAQLNGVEDSIYYSRELPNEVTQYPIVLANILRPVLLEFAPALVARLAPGGVLILSGLMDKDGAVVSKHYSELLGGRKAREIAHGEWRALVWS